MHRIRAADDDRRARVRRLPNADVEGNGAQKRDAERVGSLARPIVPEDVLAGAACAALVIRHVLDHAQNRNVDRLEHVDPFDCGEQRNVLGSRHDHSTAKRHSLGEGEMRVACSRRSVHDQVVKGSPSCFPQHLLQHGHDHRAAPDRWRRLTRRQEPHAHDRKPKVVLRNEPFRFVHFHTAGDVHEPRYGRSVDIGIEQPHGAFALGG
eukprot:Amastigsp_a841762_12.p2 type:complete len:208 gc:universal Amastigsp_a841762_12:284-907(+)